MESSSVTAVLDAEHGPYTPLPYVSLGFVVVYMVGTALWCFNWLRHERLRVPLQRLMTVVPCVKLASATLGWAFWWNCAPKGYEGTCSVPLLALYKGCDVLFNLMLYTALMFLSKGVGVLRFTVPPLELRSILWNLVVLGIAMAAQALRIPVPYFLILLVILSQIYSNLSTNLQVLESYLYAMMSSRINPITTPFFRKAFLLKKLQFLLTVYILLQVLIQFKVRFSTTTSQLFECVANHTIDLCLLGGLGLVYRLRPDVTQDALRPAPARSSSLPRRASRRPSARPRLPSAARHSDVTPSAQPPEADGPGGGGPCPGPPPTPIVPPPAPATSTTGPGEAEGEVEEEEEEEDERAGAESGSEEDAPLYQPPPRPPAAEHRGSDSPAPPSAAMGLTITEVELEPAVSTAPAPGLLAAPTPPLPAADSRPRTPASPTTPAAISAEQYHRVLDLAMVPRTRSRGLSEAAEAYLRLSCPERWAFSSFLLQYDAPSLRTWHPRLAAAGGPTRPGDLPLALRPLIPIHTVARVASPTPEQLARAPFVVVEDPPGAAGAAGAISLGTRLTEAPLPPGCLFPAGPP